MHITLATTALCLALVPLARRIDLVDHPNHRKVHETVTPLTGGPAIFVTVAVFLAVFLPDDRFAQALLIGGSLIFLAGVADDREHLSPVVRFIVQVVACLVMVYWGGIYLVDEGRLHELGDEVQLELVGI